MLPARLRGRRSAPFRAKFGGLGVAELRNTSHGHCGILRERDIRNDPALELLARTAVSDGEAGGRMVPPELMNGAPVPSAPPLDEAGLANVTSLSYAAKYASARCDPFRDAAHLALASADGRGYQIDPASNDKALRDVRADIEAGSILWGWEKTRAGAAPTASRS